MNEWALFFQLAIQIGTPFLFATLGGILNEKVGHLNLGLEGMMLMGASFGFTVAYYTGSPLLAILTAGVAGMIGALIYAVVTVTLKGDQTVTGFTITIFGTGLANFFGQSLTGLILPPEFTEAVGTVAIPLLKDIPFLGTALFTQSPYVYMGIILAVLLMVYMKKTRFGLAMRMVGENPAAADASGIPVDLYKYTHIMAGGFLTGLGGAYLSLVYVSRWMENITAGMGWIAVALIIFSTWNPMKAILGAYLFGILKGLSIKFQGIEFSVLGLELSISSQIMDMLPYVMTVLVLVFTTIRHKHGSQAPAALGKPYFREER
ncbi:MAG: ABC transporter permease [Clostridia bacterium]|nr:ABC transporter permease [Clostridia bacterium]